MADISSISDELLPLPGGPLRVWPAAVLRGAGFPVGALVALGDPDHAAAVDAGSADAAATAAAQARQHALLVAAAARPDLQTAIAWQNPDILRESIRPLSAAPGRPLNQSVRRKERITARYLARYCAKNDTIGFFGPVCWVRLNPAGPLVRVELGKGLTGARSVHLESWAADELAAAFCADPAVRRWVPPRPNPSTYLADRHLYITQGPPVPLAEPQWLLLRACDGFRPAHEVAARLVGAGMFASEPAVYGAIQDAVTAGWLLWDLEPPTALRAESVLRSAVAAIGEEPIRTRLTAQLDGIEQHVSAVAQAEGVAALDGALGALDAAFTAITAKAPRRRPGQDYAGRRLVFLDTGRDAAITFGPGLLDRLGPPLSLLMWSVRWLTSQVAASYENAFRHTFEAMGGPAQPEGIQLSFVVWQQFAAGQQPFKPALDAFVRGWESLLGIDAGLTTDSAEGLTEVVRSSADLWPAARELFPASGPGWIQAGQHGADIQIAARDAEALARGEARFVLGELHPAWNTLESAVMVERHPDPAELSRLLALALPPGRVMLVPVKGYPRISARTVSAIPDDRQWWLSLAHHPGGDPERRTSMAELRVVDSPEGLWCRTADGRRRFRVVDALGMVLAEQIVDACKLIGARHRHVPRVLLDELVVVRESWSMPLSELEPLRRLGSEAEVFARVRDLARRLGLPRFVFVSVPGELKPFYVDLTSPVLSAVLATTVRRASQDGDPDRWIRFVEMLPSPQEAWLPGPDGERYTSELRLQIADPGTPW